ncbi:MAG: alpha/beta fold hydrolase BchO [Niveispirillum sp.]|uniref:alpha/beta fold hydrolase BchO n=1 Tax=Niveispirillum sp. TaxID=1917217 RepID=UPI003BA5F9CE
MTTGGTWLDWDRDGQDWPHRSASRFVDAADLRWHIQEMGPEAAPPLLLLHGTGAASHSWRHLMPGLAGAHRIIALDLPCHGFSRPRRPVDLSLTGMTRSVQALITAIGLTPAAIIGHSAGAAIAISLAAASRRRTGPLVIAINGAFRPIRGNRLFSPLAKALFAAPFTATMFSLAARGGWFGDNLLSATGSIIDDRGADLYRRLLATSGHVQGALGMMAAWDLSRFDRLLAGLPVPPTLIAAKDDPMVPCRDSRHAAERARGARLILVDRGGHLLHEGRADLVSGLVADAIAAHPYSTVDAA